MAARLTPPLLLRPWRTADAPALREAIDESLDALRPFISWAAREPSSLAATEARLAEYARDFADGVRWRYAVLERETGALLGGASLHPYPGPGALEVGYWVRTSQHRRGVASAAAAALTRHAFSAHGVHCAEIWFDPANHGSRVVAQTLGYTPAGARLVAHADGSPREVCVYRLHDPRMLRSPTADVVISHGDTEAQR